MTPREDATQRKGGEETATLASGCFWCTEAVLEQVSGVKRVTSGYAGGKTKNPSYEDVCDGDTGHAECTQVVFDPAQVTYRQLLEIFFGTHDPTTLNRQGPDMGTQYRSALFYHSPEQKATAEAVIAELEGQRIWERPIVTEVKALETFYAAEEQHQQYFRRNPDAMYCQVIISPKLAKLRKQHAVLMQG